MRFGIRNSSILTAWKEKYIFIVCNLIILSFHGKKKKSKSNQFSTKLKYIGDDVITRMSSNSPEICAKNADFQVSFAYIMVWVVIKISLWESDAEL